MARLIGRLVGLVRRGRHGRGEEGQSLVIIVVAFIGILGFVGLSIDIAWAFVEMVRLSQAVDAAALAAAAELPVEAAARERALIYLQANGYDFEDGDTIVVTDAYTNGQYTSDPDAVTTIWIDTAYSRQQGLADSVLIRVRKRVHMVFGQFVGIDYFPVEDTAEAENISNIDTVIVYDKSGSMEYDTLCYGCWDPDPNLEYPDGRVYPFTWSTTSITAADHCAGWDSATGYNCGAFVENGTYDYNECAHRNGTSGPYYVVIEAEEYSYRSPPWERELYQPNMTFWVPQHNGGDSYDRTGASPYGSDPGTGGYISHMPAHTTMGGKGLDCQQAALNSSDLCQSICTSPAPRVEYDFYAPVTGNYHVWLRGRGGYVFWALDAGSGSAVTESGFNNSWEWQELTSSAVYLTEGAHTLRLWAGQAGFDADRIIVTNRTDTSLPSSAQALPASNGRTRSACLPCDARFAGLPGGGTVPSSPWLLPDCPSDMSRNDIYDDLQPIRESLEAAKYFVSQLNPNFDQVGYVTFGSDTDVEAELQCLRLEGLDLCTSEVVTDTVLDALDATRPGGLTNIAGGIRDGIEVLMTGQCSESDPHRCGRPGAAHIMILMSDGQPTANPGGCSFPGDPDLAWGDGTDPDKNCVVFWARRAYGENIIIYTISLGSGADFELMAYVADLTGGVHETAESPEDLYSVFQELYERIFLRLTR